MKKSKRVILYLKERVIGINKIVEYHDLVRKRRKIYDYVERYKNLPVDAMVGENWDEIKDADMHYCAKIATALDPEKIEEFVKMETKIFRLRIEQMKNTECL